MGRESVFGSKKKNIEKKKTEKEQSGLEEPIEKSRESRNYETQVSWRYGETEVKIHAK